VSAGWVTRYGSGREQACLSSDLSPGRRPRPGPACWPDQKPVRPVGV